MCSDDPNTFWNCVKNLKTDNSRTINTCELTSVQWFQYFYELLNKECEVSGNFNDYVNLQLSLHDDKCETCVINTETSDDQLNAPLTEEEVLTCLKNLPNK